MKEKAPYRPNQSLLLLEQEETTVFNPLNSFDDIMNSGQLGWNEIVAECGQLEAREVAKVINPVDLSNTVY